MAEELNKKQYSENTITSHSILWGAQRLLLIGLIARFKKNYDRYHPNDNSLISNQDTDYLHYLTHTIVAKQQSFFHLISNPGDQDEAILSSSLLILNQQIYDLLYELHFRLLDFSLDSIISVIKHLDHQMSFWNTQNMKWIDCENIEIPFLKALDEMQMIENLVLNIQ